MCPYFIPRKNPGLLKIRKLFCEISLKQESVILMHTGSTLKINCPIFVVGHNMRVFVRKPDFIASKQHTCSHQAGQICAV